MSNLARPSGQVVKIEGRPEGTTVRVDGAQVSANADGSFPLPENRVSNIQVLHGDTVLYQSQVPATQASQVANLRFVARPRYVPGTLDYVKNQAAKHKLGMSIFGIGALIGVGAAIYALSQES